MEENKELDKNLDKEVEEEKKEKNKIISRILLIIALILAVVAGMMIYNYFDGINKQYQNAEVALVEAKTIIDDQTTREDMDNNLKVGTTIGTIEVIDRTDIVPIIEGDSLDLSMNKGAGHINNSGLPGDGKQVALSAHRETFFSGLKNAKVGDKIVVTMPYGTYNYTITSSIIVKPDEGDKVYKAGKLDEEELVLITCFPFENWKNPTERIVFFAKLDK